MGRAVGSWHMGEDMGHCLIGGGEPRAAERKEDTQRHAETQLARVVGRRGGCKGGWMHGDGGCGMGVVTGVPNF